MCLSPSLSLTHRRQDYQHRCEQKNEHTQRTHKHTHTRIHTLSLFLSPTFPHSYTHIHTCMCARVRKSEKAFQENWFKHREMIQNMYVCVFVRTFSHSYTHTGAQATTRCGHII